LNNGRGVGGEIHFQKNEEPGKWGWGEDTHVEKTSVVGQKVLLQAAR
jgi:hypothetical protein